MKKINQIKNLLSYKSLVVDDKIIEAILLTIIGSKVKNQSKTSFNLLLTGESGSGKDYNVQKVLELFPSSLYEEFTRISQTSLNYLHANDKDFTWDRKVLYLQDISMNILNSDTMKVFLSDKSKIATVNNKQEAKELSVKGKPVFILTSAKPFVNEELQRRLFMVKLNTSKEQTATIVNKLDKKPSTTCNLEKEIKGYFESMQGSQVIIEHEKEIREAFPKSLVIHRTLINRFLDYIKASAILNYTDREKRMEDGELCIVTNEEDYEFVRNLFNSISFVNGITLSYTQESILDVLKSSNNKLSVNDIRGMLDFSISINSIRNNVNKLVEMEIVNRSKGFRKGQETNVYSYNIDFCREIAHYEEVHKNSDDPDYLAEDTKFQGEILKSIEEVSNHV